jgi:hypothetical protein
VRRLTRLAERWRHRRTFACRWPSPPLLDACLIVPNRFFDTTARVDQFPSGVWITFRAA